MTDYLSTTNRKVYVWGGWGEPDFFTIYKMVHKKNMTFWGGGRVN